VGPQPTIVYYDFADIRYSSFYSTGFRLNAARCGYRFQFSRKVPRLLDDPAVRVNWRNDSTRACLLLYRFTSGEDDYYFCIDTHDYSRSYPWPLLERVRAYFKVNYDPDQVPRDRDYAAQVEKIKPVMPFFPLRDGRVERLPRLLPSRTMAWNHHDMARRIIDAPRVPTLQALRALRGGDKAHDVVFLSAYYPEAVHAPAMELRYELMREFDRLGFSRSLYGFATRMKLPEPFATYSMPRFSFEDYLRALAQARLAIYVRGCLDCISFKFEEYLCLGVPVVGQTIANNRERLTGLPHVAEQFAFDSPGDIAREAAVLLGEGDRSRALAESNARVFDTDLSPQATTAEVLEVLGVHAPGSDRRT